MNPSIKAVLWGLLAAALSVGGALYAQRILRENRARLAPAAAAGSAASAAPAAR